MSKEDDVYTTLMASQDFRDWVNNPTKERDEYWHKWIESNEHHLEVVNKAKRCILNYRFKEDFLSEDQLEKMLSNIISEDKPDQNLKDLHKTKRRFPWVAVAASLAVVFVAGFLFRDDLRSLFSGDRSAIAMKHVSNPAGQKSQIKLPDGSSVVLNANSSLSFPERFSGKSRIVTLTGEAFFQVKGLPSMPFIVHVDRVDVEVKGTSFNVNAYDSKPSVHVALVEGQVVVRKDQSNESITLFPGQKVSYLKEKELFQKSEFNPAEEVGWKDGVLFFRDVSFEAFVQRLEQWYGVEILTVNKPKKEWRVNGRFDNESLEEVLLGVQFTYNIDFEIQGKKVALIINN